MRDPSAARLRYDEYLPAGTKVDNPAEIDTYNDSIRAFRAYLQNNGVPLSPEMRMQTGAVKAEINAQGELVALQRMLTWRRRGETELVQEGQEHST